MVVRSMPASRSQKLSVPNTSSKGSPPKSPAQHAQAGRLQVDPQGVAASAGRGAGVARGNGVMAHGAVLVAIIDACVCSALPQIKPSAWSFAPGFLLAAGALPPARPRWRRWMSARRRSLRKLVPADELESAAASSTPDDGRGPCQAALAPDNHPQLQRLRAIARA
jgi:hypothetical protein